MQPNTFRPCLESLEDRQLMSASPMHVSAPRPEARCVGFFITSSNQSVEIRNTSKYNVSFQIDWGDNDTPRYESFVIKAGKSLKITHRYDCPADGATIRFDKAVKSGYQAVSYRLTTGSTSSPALYKFINTTWSASGPGVSLRSL